MRCNPLRRFQLLLGAVHVESGGVKPTEVTFIQNGGVGESYAALVGGRVDVCMIGYPFGLSAKNAGFNLLFRPSQTEYGLFPKPSSERASPGSRNPKIAKVHEFFLRALHEGQQIRQGKCRGRPSARCENLPEPTMTRCCKAPSISTKRPSRVLASQFIVEKAMTNALSPSNIQKPSSSM